MLQRRTMRASAWLLCLWLGLAGCGDGGGASPSGVGVGKSDATGSTHDIASPDTGESTDVVADASQPTDTAGEADAQVADVAADATSTVDAGADGSADAGITCPGSEGCACVENSDCDNSICLDTADGKRCAKACVENCPKGFTCGKLGAADATFVCIPSHLTTCSPCTTNADCQYQQADAICLDYGDVGRFCGGPCKVDSDCPSADYACISVLDESSGQTKSQCKIKMKKTAGSGASCAKDVDCGAGETCVDKACGVYEQPACGCSTWAKSAAKIAPCKASNSFGACSGKRSCGATGLSACSAAVPAEETCNTIDDDCDGTTDNLPATVTCSQKAWLPLGSKTACKTDGDCGVTGEACDPSDGLCKTLIGACPGKPVCTKGKVTCSDAKTPKMEACNTVDDDCDGATDETFAWTDPVKGTTVTVGGICGVGPCAGGLVACETLLSAACTTELAKKKKEVCNSVDDDCNGEVDDAVCDDGSECTADVCDGKSGTCTNPATVTCDDKNACTTDSCDKKAGKCVYSPYQGSCDDGDACTVGDVCGLNAAAKHVCLPGKSAKKCDDSNPCTDDSCDKGKGCVQLPNAATEVCYGGAKGTLNVGTCHAGVRHCKAGKLVATCVGEVAPVGKELCDGKDDSCDGVTDEGCKAGQVAGSFAAAFGSVAGKNKQGAKRELLVEVGGSSPTGRVTGKGKVGEMQAGFIAWLQSVLK